MRGLQQGQRAPSSQGGRAGTRFGAGMRLFKSIEHQRSPAELKSLKTGPQACIAVAVQPFSRRF